jgi:hypothetical protein
MSAAARCIDCISCDLKAAAIEHRQPGLNRCRKNGSPSGRLYEPTWMRVCDIGFEKADKAVVEERERWLHERHGRVIK